MAIGKENDKREEGEEEIGLEPYIIRYMGCGGLVVPLPVSCELHETEGSTPCPYHPPDYRLTPGDSSHCICNSGRCRHVRGQRMLLLRSFKWGGIPPCGLWEIEKLMIRSVSTLCEKSAGEVQYIVGTSSH